MNNNFWIYLSFMLMVLITFKVIILTYISKLKVDNDIVMAIIFVLVGLLGLLYLITHKYDTFNFIKKCNFSLFAIIIITAFIIGLQYTIMPSAYGLSPNPAFCSIIMNLNVIFVLLFSYYLFHSSINIKTFLGIIISLIGLILILNN